MEADGAVLGLADFDDDVLADADSFADFSGEREWHASWIAPRGVVARMSHATRRAGGANDGIGFR